MNEEIMQYINFDNVVSVLYMVFTAISVIIAMKMKADNIISKYKLKKAENERDEAYTALDNVSQTMTNFGDTLNLLSEGSKLDPATKIAITQTWAKQREVVKTAGSLVQPVLGVVMDVLEDVIQEGKDSVGENIIKVGASVLEKYANSNKDS